MGDDDAVRRSRMKCAPAGFVFHAPRYRRFSSEFQSMTLVSPTLLSVRQAVAGDCAGSEVTIKGWVRTRRDSKAGLSFVNGSDGSCFAPIQVVAGANLANYESVVKHLTSGAAVVATGKLVPSQGKGQGFEIQATGIELIGAV